MHGFRHLDPILEAREKDKDTQTEKMRFLLEKAHTQEAQQVYYKEVDMGAGLLHTAEQGGQGLWIKWIS